MADGPEDDLEPPDASGQSRRAAAQMTRQKRARRFGRLRGPALAAGGFALISPLGIGFAAAVTAVAAGMFLMSRRSARRDVEESDSSGELMDRNADPVDPAYMAARKPNTSRPVTTIERKTNFEEP